MRCPACGDAFSPMTLGEITVDVCEGGCGGIWFDHYELTKVDESHESAGQALLDIEGVAGVGVDRSKRISCPKCADVVMMRHFFRMCEPPAFDPRSATLCIAPHIAHPGE